MCSFFLWIYIGPVNTVQTHIRGLIEILVTRCDVNHLNSEKWLVNIVYDLSSIDLVKTKINLLGHDL